MEDQQDYSNNSGVPGAVASTGGTQTIRKKGGRSTVLGDGHAPPDLRPAVSASAASKPGAVSSSVLPPHIAAMRERRIAAKTAKAAARRASLPDASKDRAANVSSMSRSDPNHYRAPTTVNRGLRRTEEEREAKLRARRVSSGSVPSASLSSHHPWDPMASSDPSNYRSPTSRRSHPLTSSAPPVARGLTPPVTRGLRRTEEERVAKIRAKPRHSNGAAVVPGSNREGNDLKTIGVASSRTGAGLRRSLQDARAKQDMFAPRNSARSSRSSSHEVRMAAIPPPPHANSASKMPISRGLSRTHEELDTKRNARELHHRRQQEQEILIPLTSVSDDEEESPLVELAPAHDPVTSGSNDLALGLLDPNLGLVEALPVADDTSDFMRAEQVDLQEHTRQKEKERKQFRRKMGIFAAAFVVILCVLVGIIAATLSSKSGSKEVTRPPATSPPTTQATSAPTTSLELLFQNLPNYTQQSIQQNSSSPQYLAWDWLSNRYRNSTNLPQWKQKQLFALATFFYAFEGERWPKPIQERWLTDEKDECLWHSSEYGRINENGTYIENTDPLGDRFGLDPCNDETGEFQALYLSDLNLSQYKPSIPPEIALLTNLNSLILHNSGVNTTITTMLPSQLYQMTNLTFLNLYNNFLTGAIPSELGVLTSMTWLDLSFNPLDGQLPTELGLMTSLIYLGSGESRQSGTLPSQLGFLTDLKLLYLLNSGVTGTLPTELGLMNAMERISCSDNGFTGTLPSELGLLSKMTGLYLLGSNIHGALPSELGSLSGLVEFELSGNALNGTIPTEFSMPTNLTKLYLFANSLSGTIPSEIARLTSMRKLGLAINSLSGAIPTELGLLNSTTHLYLYRNALSGSIPTELGLLTSTTRFYLYNNSISGPIPTELGQLSSTPRLYLYSNSLTGSIPYELGGMTSIEKLLFNDNSLTGQIPSELGAWAVNGSLQVLSLAGNELSGTVPGGLCLLGEVGLSFDCNISLCGCDWCACQPLQNASNAMIAMNRSTNNIFVHRKG